MRRAAYTSSTRKSCLKKSGHGQPSLGLPSLPSLSKLRTPAAFVDVDVIADELGRHPRVPRVEDPRIDIEIRTGYFSLVYLHLKKNAEIST